MKTQKPNLKIAVVLIITLTTLLINISAFSQAVGISGEYFAIDSSAILELKDTKKGFLMTRLTTLHRDSICIVGAGCYGYKPAEGLIIFNTTTKCFEGYVGSSWIPITCATCGGILTDSRDSKTYSTVLIGTQCWMAENLNYGTYVTAATGQGGAGTQKYCYSNNTANCTTYGGLYEWTEIMNGASSSSSNPSGVQGICPIGWHLPSDAEWIQMEEKLGMCTGSGAGCSGDTLFRGTDEGQQLAGNEPLWGNGILDVTGAGSLPFGDSGFDALPSGYSWVGSFSNLSSNGFWWSATENSTKAWFRALNYNVTTVNRQYSTKAAGYSVRCLKN